MFYALSENGQAFQDQVSIYIALAPITKITNNTVPGLDFVIYNYSEMTAPQLQVTNNHK